MTEDLDDFDENTLENIDQSSNEPIGPIAGMRRKKEIQDNTFTISRENFDKSSNEQIEAWFTKFDQVIIDDSKNPYKEYKAPLTKKELAVKIGVLLYSNLNRSNMQKGIGLIQKSTSMISEFGKAFGGTSSNSRKTDTSFLISSETSQRTSSKTSKRKPKRNSLMIWSDEKKHQVKPRKRRKAKVQKEQSNFLTGGKKIVFSNKKVKFF